MNRFRSLFALFAVALATACATTAPPPAVAPQGDDRFLIDPRTGFESAAPESLDRRLDDAWRTFEAGDPTNARLQLERIRSKNPTYTPAVLAMAAIDIHDRQFDRALSAVRDVEEKHPAYVAARVYDAEIAVREGDVRRGYQQYSDLARAAVPDIVRTRTADLRRQLLDQIVASARTAPAPQSVPLLREALTLDPGAAGTRMLLVQQLIDQKDWDAARSELDPLLNTNPDRTDVQQALAEIDAGRGQYEQAIARYERLVRREKNPKLAQRLDEIKLQWNAANMPPQAVRALESDAITRADLAVLLFWNAASIRFAQNLGPPPIAVDVEEVLGREELIRAITVGMLPVDPVTRRVNPNAQVTAPQLTRYAARVLTSRGAACTRGAGGDTAKIVAACGITDLSATQSPDAPVSGRDALTVVTQIERALQ